MNTRDLDTATDLCELLAWCHDVSRTAELLVVALEQPEEMGADDLFRLHSLMWPLTIGLERARVLAEAHRPPGVV